MMATEINRISEATRVDQDSNERRRILFVGGLPGAVDEETLKNYFSKMTQVSNIKIARDKKSKSSKGYAYVTLAEASAIPKIVGTHHHLYGRKLDVQVASRKGERHVWKNEQRKRRLFLVNLPADVSTQEFEEAFSQFGPVHNAYTVVETDGFHEKPYGYVEFENPESADKALASKVFIRGTMITISKFRNKDISHGVDETNIQTIGLENSNSKAKTDQPLERFTLNSNILKNSGSSTSIKI
jgi:RNA-binding protein Musashi